MAAGWPPSTIVAAIACGSLVFVLLIVLGVISPALRRPGVRYRVSVGCAGLLLLVWLVVLALARTPAAAIDYAADAAIMVSATIIAFVAWSLIAWGFTLSMLLALAHEKRFTGLDEWIRGYTGGADFRRLAADRASVLMASRFAVEVGGNAYRLTSFGRIASTLVGVGRWTFGIRDAEWNRR